MTTAISGMNLAAKTRLEEVEDLLADAKSRLDKSLKRICAYGGLAKEVIDEHDTILEEYVRLRIEKSQLSVLE